MNLPLEYYLKLNQEKHKKQDACQGFFQIFRRHYDVKVVKSLEYGRLVSMHKALIDESPILEVILYNEIIDRGPEEIDEDNTLIAVILNYEHPLTGKKGLESTHPLTLLENCPELADLFQRLKEKEEMTEELGQEATPTKSKTRL